MKKTSIYKITNLINGKAYIGVSADPSRRFLDHSKKSNDTVLSRAIRKYGKKNFKIETILIGEADYCYEMEQAIITAYGTNRHDHGYNVANGGRGGHAGIKRSQETKDKISAAKKGVKLGPASDETRAKMSQARKLVVMPPMTDQTKAKHAENMRKRMADPEQRAKASPLGRKHAADTKEKLSERRRAYLSTLSPEEKSSQTSIGRQRAIENKMKTYTALSPDGDQFSTTNLKEFAKQRGIDGSTAYKVVSGKIAHAKGWRFWQGDPPKDTPSGRITRWIVTGPDDMTYDTSDLKGFCEARGLNYRSVKNNKVGYQGWSASKYGEQN